MKRELTSTMLFKDITGTKSKIEWTIFVKPRCCCRCVVGRYLRKVYWPRVREDFAYRLSSEIDKKYASEYGSGVKDFKRVSKVFPVQERICTPATHKTDITQEL
jgi:hypothetical protein